MPRWRREDCLCRLSPVISLFCGSGRSLRIADFIYVAVNAAKNAHLERLIVGRMPGKLFKYACGEKYTHAHKNETDAAASARAYGGTAGGTAAGVDAVDGRAGCIKVPAELYRKILYACYEASGAPSRRGPG
ncbi:MAG: hypothetical protein V8T87_12870 [Victivallales bacterium]